MLRSSLLHLVIVPLCGAVVLLNCSSGDSGTSSTATTSDGHDGGSSTDSDDDGQDDDTSDDTPDDEDPSGGLSVTADGQVVYDADNLPGGGFVSIEDGEDGSLEILCGDTPCACSDGIDNDEDGTADGFDDECTGPFDDDESTFATGIPGDNRDPKWQDCFFDGNSGAGDDGCRYHTDCLTGDIDQEDGRCSVAEQCRDFCAPLAPPGCDCFGCCDVDVDGELISILVGPECSTEEIDDEQKCPRCVPTDSCRNDCGVCEICVGKGVEDLADECYETPPPTGDPSDPDAPDAAPPPDDQPPPNVCDNDAQACSSNDDCGDNAACSLGCCRTLIQVK